jgi:hypothetical protein
MSGMDEKPMTFWQRWVNPKRGTREWWKAWLLWMAIFGTLMAGAVALVYFFPSIIKP